MHYISILSTLVTVVFTLAVFNRYRRRGGMHLLLWGIGLTFYGLGTLSEAIMLYTFNSLALKIWYISGAMLTAAWLGEGTVHLLVRKRGVAMALTAALAIVSLASIILVAMAPITSAAGSFNVQAPVSSQYKDILVRNGAIVLLTILLNIYGTLTMVGGAIYSAFLFWRKKVLANRMLGNILIAGGALMPAMGGSFIRAGLPDWLYLSEFIGAVLMFTGFLWATSAQPVKGTQPA
ncbi:MAG: hypothetical protein EHM70_11165 [Chloroflexota bacterium]|nr:MAG: hypothetical protein EHM70_11165 [Chloroflexota bacterium]